MEWDVNRDPEVVFLPGNFIGAPQATYHFTLPRKKQQSAHNKQEVLVTVLVDHSHDTALAAQLVVAAAAGCCLTCLSRS